MSNSKITVSGLALLLAKMQGVDIDVLARAANLPHKNVQAWLGGNRSCLRVNSIVTLMALLGLRLDAGVWRLDADRVHFWHLNLGAFTSADRVLGSLTLLSKMLGGAAITRIRPPKGERPSLWSTDYFMLGGDACRVVVSVKRPSFRKVRVSPDVVKGGRWRDDNKHHTMLIPETHWAHVCRRDMTPKEFDLAFNASLSAMAWNDLGLAARQYNLTPEDLLEWIRERHEPADQAARSANANAEVDVPAGSRVILLGQERRTGTYG